MEAVDKLIQRFIGYIKIQQDTQIYNKIELFNELMDAIDDSITNIKSLHKVRDLIREIQSKLDSENSLLLNIYLMALFSSLAHQYQSKELLYFAAVACNNVRAIYYFIYQNEITSPEVKYKCDEMMAILLGQLSGTEVVRVASEIIKNEIANQK